MSSLSTFNNLENFGYRELALAIELLTLYSEYKLPESFVKEGVTIMFNHYSGMVFITNAEYQVLATNKGKLELFYTTPYKGIEGYKEELLEMLRIGEITHFEDVEFVLALTTDK